MDTIFNRSHRPEHSETAMLDGEKILITGATGKIAFPIARALAGKNEVWGAARLRNPAVREKLQTAGIKPLAIIRVCSTYGPLGGAPADRLDAIL